MVLFDRLFGKKEKISVEQTKSNDELLQKLQEFKDNIINEFNKLGMEIRKAKVSPNDEKSRVSITECLFNLKRNYTLVRSTAESIKTDPMVSLSKFADTMVLNLQQLINKWQEKEINAQQLTDLLKACMIRAKDSAGLRAHRQWLGGYSGITEFPERIAA